MAKEIIVLEVVPGTGATSDAVRLAFLFPVDAQTPGVVPTPVTGPDGLDPVAALLTGPEITALDDGSMLWRAAGFALTPGMTQAQIVARAREIYAAHAATVQQDYVDRYQHTGKRFNATA